MYNNLLDIKDNFDVFLFDAFGVFWNGSGFFEGARYVMKELVRDGKIVCILSNTTKDEIDAMNNYIGRGLTNNIYYKYFFSSGQVIRHYLRNGLVKFKTNPNPQNVYFLGGRGKSVFKNTKYNIVPNIEDADFVYCADPELNKEQYEKYPHKEHLHKISGHDLWNITSLDPFMPEINRILELKLPIINANPDYIANMGTENGGTVFAIRNGTFAKYLIENGIDDYLEFGKPHKNTYDFVFDYLKKQDINIDKNRTCMIGDTLRTDIRGAVDSGIKGVLCYETGVTAEQMRQGKSFDDLIKEENGINVDYIIKSVSGMI